MIIFYSRRQMCLSHCVSRWSTSVLNLQSKTLLWNYPIEMLLLRASSMRVEIRPRLANIYFACSNWHKNSQNDICPTSCCPFHTPAGYRKQIKAYCWWHILDILLYGVWLMIYAVFVKNKKMTYAALAGENKTVL